jgi:fatty acid desaturase
MHHITSDLSSWSSREVHQANKRVLRTSNKIAQKTSSFYFTYYIIITICKRDIYSRDKVFHNFSYFLQEPNFFE